MSSKRAYTVAGFENGHFVRFELSIKDLVEDKEDSFESLYAIQEEVDEILDLKVDETLSVSLNRDNKNCKGILLRIK